MADELLPRQGKEVCLAGLAGLHLVNVRLGDVRDQRVDAVYIDKNRRVQRIANYGLQDGKIFDSVTRTTPTAGQELSYLTYVFKVFGK